MTRQELTLALADRLRGLPWEEIERSMEYYDEMIDERMEEGMSEHDAIAALGSVDDIAAQILADIPLSRLVRAKVKPRRSLRAWEIVLLAVGAPVWFPVLLALAITAFAVVLSLYAVLWALVLTLYAVELAFAVVPIAAVPAAVWLICGGHAVYALFYLGAALICLGLAIGMYYVCKHATRGALRLGKLLLLGIKSLFVRKERTS